MDPSLQQPVDQPLAKRYSVRRATILAGATFAVLGLMAIAVWFVRTHSTDLSTGVSAASRYPVANVPVNSLPLLPAQAQTNQLVVNGQAQVTNGLVLQPSITKPDSAVTGELYYDKTTNQPYFYNGTAFVSLQGTSTVVNNFIGGSTTTIVQGGGTTLSGLTVDGVAYADSLSTLKTTGTTTNGILTTNGAGIPSITQTLPTVVQGNITSTGSLGGGSISNGFGAISTTNTVATTGVLQGGSILLGSDGGLPPSTGLRGGVATGTNITGNDLFFDAADGTGTGGSGSLVFRTGMPNIFVPTNDTNSSASTDFATATSLTWAHTTNTNSNRLLVVGVTISDNTKTITGVTYGGVALTGLAGQDCSATCRVEFWYLVGPAVGTANVVVTLSGAAEINAGASTYFNVDPTTPIATFTTDANVLNPSSVTLNGTNATQVVVDVFGDNNRLFGVAGSNILRWNTDGLTDSPNGSSSLAAGSPSTTMSWNDASSSWATVVAALNPPSGSTPNTLVDRLNITNTGDVGINNSNPQYTLDVGGSGNFKVTSSTAFQIQDASGSLLFTANTTSMTVTVAALSVTGALTLNGHVITAGATPTIGAGAGACTSPTVTVIGNDTAGQISVTTGTGCGGAGVLASLTFNSPYGIAPYVQITPGNAAAAALLPYQSSTTTGLTLGVANGPTDSTAYLFDYLVTQ